MTLSADNLIWIDLEMTGLEPARDRILEIATVITDPQLNVLAEGPVFAIRQPEAVLTRLDEWNSKQHGGSGLLARVRSEGVSEEHAERETLQFLAQWVKPGSSPICGNSIGQDRRFLYRYMPQLEAFFHYRHLDVSTLKELLRRWKPGVVESVAKEGRHLALDDIRDSIAELRHYRAHCLNC